MIRFIAFIFLSFFAMVSFAKWKPLACEGSYSGHLQGMAVDGDKIFWSFTTKVVKTDANGKIEKIIDVPWHHGDCCVHEGKLYVAVESKRFNSKDLGEASVRIYDSNLNFLKTIPIPEIKSGLGGMEYHNGSFYLVGGIHSSEPNFKIYKCSKDFKLQKVFDVPVGESNLGVQTICYCEGRFWLGVYLKNEFSRTKLTLWETDENFNVLKKHKRFDSPACGIAPIKNSDGSNFLISKTGARRDENGKFHSHTAKAKPEKIEITQLK